MRSIRRPFEWIDAYRRRKGDIDTAIRVQTGWARYPPGARRVAQRERLCSLICLRKCYTKDYINTYARVNEVEEMPENQGFPRLLRPVETPLALYLRPGRNDHVVLAQALTEGADGIRGIVFDPGRLKAQKELRDEASRRRAERILDTRMMELAIVTAKPRPDLMSLGWAAAAKLSPDELRASGGEDAASSIARFVAENGFSAVLAPTHYMGDPELSWLQADVSMTRALRNHLDQLGQSHVPIYYPLALASAAFRERSVRSRTVSALRDLAIDSVWLRIHPFGTATSGPIVLRSYIEACQELHRLGVPLVAERCGTVGVALLAFGAVGGVESGITTGESFDFGRLARPPKKGRLFLAPPRVYLKELGVFLSAKAARAFFDLRGTKAFFACRERCCPRGVQDMLADSRRHFIHTRAQEVSRISSVPIGLRRQIYMEDFLRPATDRALQATRVYPELEAQRRRLESSRGTLGAVARDNPLKSWSGAPDGKRVRNGSKASA